MLNIKEQLSVSIKIDGQELEYANLISVVGVEGNYNLAPALKIVLGDPKSNLSSYSTLTDANKVEVLVSKTTQDNVVQPRTYRGFGSNRNDAAENPVLTMVAVLDSPKFFVQNAAESLEGTSEDVLRKIAETCGLKFSGLGLDGKTPLDNQKWLNIRKNRAVFTQEIAKHAWLDKHSCMVAAVTSAGELRFRNLTTLINTPIDKIKYVFSHNAHPTDLDKGKKTYVVRSARDNSSAGVMATWQNYGSTTVLHRMSGLADSFSEQEVKLPGNYLPINKSVSDSVGRARVSCAQLDCGNTYDRYEQARYQNEKLKALYCEGMSLLVYEVTDVQLFDVVIYRQEDGDPTKPIKNTDIYIVMGKTFAVSGGAFYAERIELKRMSLIMKGTAELTLPLNSAGEASAIPDITINPSFKGLFSAATRGVVTSINDALNSVKSGNAMLDGLIGSMLAPVRNVINTGTSALSAIMNSNFNPTNVQELLGTVRSLASATNSIKDAINYVGGANGHLLEALKNQASAIQYQVISQAESITTSLLNQYLIQLPAQAAVGALSSLVEAAPKEVLNIADAYKDLHQELNLAASEVSNLVGYNNQQWNKTLSILRNLPSGNASTMPQIYVDLQQGMWSANASEASLLNLLHASLNKNELGAPSWLPETSPALLAISNVRGAIGSAKGLLDTATVLANTAERIHGQRLD